MWNMRSVFDKEFKWEPPIISAIGRQSYSSDTSCVVGLSGRFNSHLEWVGYTYDDTLNPVNVGGIIAAIVIPLLFIGSIVACCYCGCC